MKESSSLAHYGVMGMKWGVRKDGKPQGYQGSGNSRRQSGTEKTAIRSEKEEHRKLARSIDDLKRPTEQDFSWFDRDQDKIVRSVRESPRVKNAEETARKTEQNLRELPSEKTAKAHTESLLKLHDEVKTARTVAEVEAVLEAEPTIKKHVSIDKRGNVTVSDELRKHLNLSPKDIADSDPEFICFVAWEYEDNKYWDTH